MVSYGFYIRHENAYKKLEYPENFICFVQFYDVMLWTIVLLRTSNLALVVGCMAQIQAGVGNYPPSNQLLLRLPHNLDPIVSEGSGVHVFDFPL